VKRAPYRKIAVFRTTLQLKKRAFQWITGISLAATFEGDISDVAQSYAGKGVARYHW
jgi:hypothetical protein